MTAAKQFEQKDIQQAGKNVAMEASLMPVTCCPINVSYDARPAYGDIVSTHSTERIVIRVDRHVTKEELEGAYGYLFSYFQLKFRQILSYRSRRIAFKISLLQHGRQPESEKDIFLY